jgi:hypothetical protein
MVGQPRRLWSPGCGFFESRVGLTVSGRSRAGDSALFERASTDTAEMLALNVPIHPLRR